MICALLLLFGGVAVAVGYEILHPDDGSVEVASSAVRMRARCVGCGLLVVGCVSSP